MHKQYPTNVEDIGFQKCQLLSNCLDSVSHSEIRNTTTTSPGLEPRKGVFHCGLESLCYNLVDMHKVTPNIHEVIAFIKWLGVKQILQNVKSVV
jgi:hypothetical protein